MRSALRRSTFANIACESSPTGSRRCPSSSTGSTAGSRAGPAGRRSQPLPHPALHESAHPRRNGRRRWPVEVRLLHERARPCSADRTRMGRRVSLRRRQSESGELSQHFGSFGSCVDPSPNRELPAERNVEILDRLLDLDVGGDPLRRRLGPFVTAARVASSRHSTRPVVRVSAFRRQTTMAVITKRISWTLRLYQPETRSIESSNQLLGRVLESAQRCSLSSGRARASPLRGRSFGIAASERSSPPPRVRAGARGLAPPRRRRPDPSLASASRAMSVSAATNVREGR